MNVVYSNESIISNKNSGIYLSKEDAATAPKINFGKLLKKGKYYTLIMHDPNAVNDNHNVNHWVITNIQLTNTYEPLHKQGLLLLDYKGPTPPDLSGIHKYIFTLYLQPNVFKLTESKTVSDLREALLLTLLVKLGLKEAKIIDQVFFTSSFSKGGRKTRRKMQKKRKTRRKRLIKRS
jgi:phosphatidylethanolamine-binding protein (PEBP) family uncharacterized protein